jgi:polyisoprenoid-binding protein YceI
MTISTSTLPLVPGRWVVDHNHSSINFSIRYLGVSKVRGRFTSFDAKIIIGEALEDTSVTATIEVASIDTGRCHQGRTRSAAPRTCPRLT